MKSILTMITLLAAATAVSAQTPPPQPPREAVQLPRPVYPPAQAFPYPVTDLQEFEAAVQPASDCPVMKGGWYVQTLQNAGAAWMRLRSMCGTAKPAGCCDSDSGPSNVCKATGCAAGVAGCAKSCEMIQAPKACACAKACACCESCKAARNKQEAGIFPQAPPMLFHGMRIHPASAAQITLPTMPVGGPPFGMMPHGCFLPVQLGAAPAKLVTPDFEAHCNQMIQRGDSIELVGNVMLLCKKYAQPLRIEAQRVVINLNNGTFVVESGPSLPCPVPAIGVRTMSIEMAPVQSGGARRPASAVVPASGIIEVVPVPTLPTVPRSSSPR